MENMKPTPAQIAEQISDLTIQLHRTIRDGGPGWETADDVADTANALAPFYGYHGAIIIDINKEVLRHSRRGRALHDITDWQAEKLSFFGAEAREAADTVSRMYNRLCSALSAVAGTKE
jgi:hypothetical protein